MALILTYSNTYDTYQYDPETEQDILVPVTDTYEDAYHVVDPAIFEPTATGAWIVVWTYLNETEALANNAFMSRSYHLDGTTHTVAAAETFLLTLPEWTGAVQV